MGQQSDQPTFSSVEPSKRFTNWDNQVFNIKDEEVKCVDPQQQFVLDCVHMTPEDGMDSFVLRSMVWTLLPRGPHNADSHECFCYIIVLSPDIVIVRDNETYKLHVYHLHDGKLLTMFDKLKSRSYDICILKRSDMHVMVTGDNQIVILAVETIGKSAVIRCDMTLNILRTFDIRLGAKALNHMKKLVVSGGKWVEYTEQDNVLCICWDIVSTVNQYVDTVQKICEGDGFSYLVTSPSDSMVYISCWTGLNLPNTSVYVFNARFGRQEFKYCHVDLTGPGDIYVDSRGFIYVCNREPQSFHQLIGIEEPVTVHKERMPAWLWAMYFEERRREFCLKSCENKEIWRLRLVLPDQQETISLAILKGITQTSVLHETIIGFLSAIHEYCRDDVLSAGHHKKNLLALLCQCKPTDMEVCTRQLLVSVCTALLSLEFVLMCILMDYVCQENVTMGEVAVDPSSCLVIFESKDGSITPHSRNARGMIQSFPINKQQINVVTKCDTITFDNFIPVTYSINNAKLDKLGTFFHRAVTYNSGIALETPDVRTQPSPSTNQLNQGRVEGIVFKVISSKHKKKGKENKMQTKKTSLKAIEINSRMFEKYSIVVPDVTLDRRENEKQDINTSHVLAKLQPHNTSVNLNEGSREEMGLEIKKKHNLIQMMLPHLEELPQPHVHREVIVGFLSGEYSKSPEEATCSPTEHGELGEILKRLASDDIPGPKITMQFEMLRLCTLKNYPRENKPFAVRLVAAGFYYAGYRDQLICYCCAIRKDNWVGGDIPILIHQKMSPDCSFLTKNVSVNIPVKRHASAESTPVRLLVIQRLNGSNQSDVAQSESSLLLPSCEQKRLNISNMPHQMLVTNKGSTLTQMNASGGQNILDNLRTINVNTDSVGEPPPKYPQYAVINARINTFQGWPEECRQRPEEMAECGFYYAGFSDCVRCFYCGVGLRHWMSEDDPWIEHARWSTSCVYVLKMKGNEFVSLVKMAVEIAEREAARTNNGENQANPSDHREVTTIARSEGSTTTEGGVSEATSSTTSSGNTEMQKYLLTDAAQSVLDMGYQPKMVLRAIERLLRKMGSEELTAQIIMEAVLDIEEAEGAEHQPQPLIPNTGRNDEGTTKDGHETEDSATGNEQSVNQEIDPEMIMREHRELRDATLCKICLDNKICVVFLPCGHLVTCADCAPAMRKCPICRTLIKGTVKTFFG